jgi:hypothetical protein
MREQYPVTETMAISNVRSELNSLVNRVYRHETRVVVEKSSIPVTAIVSRGILNAWTGSTSRINKPGRCCAPFRDISDEAIEREAERAVAEVRAEMRAEPEKRAAG